MSSRLKLLMALLVTASACARVGVPTPAPGGGAADPHDVLGASALSGVATLGDQRLRVLVALSTDSLGRSTAHLEIPALQLTAEGAAVGRDDTLELDLHYGGACPGALRIRATRASNGTQLGGTMTAKDCTGGGSGTVVLEAAPPPRASLPGAPAR
ncbi:MAG TPA: hypothetical protein VJ997_07325 [Longimicrobiales bacterium]|nr:hypothetical protein [Longimicrobiales bacterium]